MELQIYRDLVESAPDATLVIDSEGGILVVNAQIERLFGYPRAELLGQSMELLVPERLRSSHRVHRDGYFADPKPREMGAGIELTGRRRDGSEFPLEISLSPLRTPRGLCATAAIRDISDRKKANEKFRALLEAAPDAMIIIDQHGLIRLVNAQTERLFGYTREALVGKPVEVLVPERLRGRHAGHRTSYLSQPKVRPMGAGLELLGRRKDGTEFSIEISLGPLETESGQWATAAVRDVSERKAAEQKLSRSAEQLKRSNAELEQFAYAASHDLSAPVRSIMGFAQILQKRYQGKLDADADSFLGDIVNGAAHMQALIEGLLAYSRIRSGDTPPVPVNCENLLGQVLQQLHATISERHAQITHDRLPTVPGMPLQLHQLFQNLIANGLKFQPGDAPRVHISAQRDGEYQYFSVQDWGIGIRPEHRSKIFVIFQRLHAAEDYEGTGIGLALCQKIVHQHGGQIWFDSEPGQGSTFHFTLRA